MFSPTAKIMKAYFRELTWDTSEFIHDLIRSQSGIHRYEMGKIIHSKAWFREHVMKNIHLYRQIMNFYIDIEYWENELPEWVLSNSILKLAVHDNCPSLNKKSGTRIIDFCFCSKYCTALNVLYFKGASLSVSISKRRITQSLSSIL